MYRIILAVLTVATLCAFPAHMMADPVQERVIQLPEDAAKWHLVLILHQDWQQRPQEVNLVQSFERERRLAALKRQTHFRLWTENTDHYRLSPKWQESVPPSMLPAVVITRGDGWKAYVRTANRIPATAVALGNDIADCWPLPRPQPQPAPLPVTPDQPVLPDTPLIPDTPPAVEPAPAASTGNDAWVLIVGALVGAGLMGTAIFRSKLG